MESRLNKGTEYTRSKLSVHPAAFLLPVVLYFLMLAHRGCWPFSDICALGGDMYNQYLDYYRYMHRVFSGESHAFYSFAKTIGGDMTGLWSYYLFSPLNLLMLPVSENYLPAAVVIIVAIKLGLSGLFMSVFLSRRGGRGFSTLIFSSAYALMAYNIIYYNNLMWLDGVYTLPLALMGLEMLLEGRSPALYILALCYCLVTNYYIGYMICIFMVLFFLWKLAAEKAPADMGLIRLFGRFALASLLAGMMAAVVLLPTALSLTGTKMGFDSASLEMYPMYTLGELLRKLVCGTFTTGLAPGEEVLHMLPSIYCGAVTSFFALLYFFNSGISLRRRIATALGFVVMYLSFSLNGLYVIWHAFNYPSLFPYRFAFLLCFMMVACAGECWRNRASLKLWNFIPAAAALGIALLLIDPLGTPYVSKKMLALDLSAMAVCVLALLWERKRPRWRSVGAVAVCLAQLSLIFINDMEHINRAGSIPLEEHALSRITDQAIIDTIQNTDVGFYRINDMNAGNNHPIRHEYNALSHFSSTERQSTKRFAINFGLYHFAEVWVRAGDSCSKSADAFLGVKYQLNHEQVQDYEKAFEFDENAAYLNPRALPLAFPADKEVLDAPLEERDIYRWQEQVWSASLGHEAGIMLKQENVEFESVNLKSAPYLDGATRYDPVDPSQPTSLVYSFEAQSDQPLYMYTSEPIVAGEIMAELFVNGQSLGNYMGSYHWRSVCLGSFEKGERVEVELRPLAGFFLQYDTYFYYEDGAALDAACEEILRRADGSSFEKLSDAHLLWQGSIGEDNQLLMLTVPLDKGWRATVDGEEAELSRALDCMIAIELAPGEHIVELRFTPPGLYAGALISLAAIAIFLAWLYREKKN